MSHTSTVILSCCAPQALREALSAPGRTLRLLPPAGVTYWPVDAHPDLFFCQLHAQGQGRLFQGDAGELGAAYPENCRFNAVCLDRSFLHRLSVTSPALLAEVRRMGLTPIHVRQGYTKCNTVVVDGRSVITSDPGILRTLRAYPDIDTLAVRPGFVRLEGFPCGFLGGASGRVGDTLYFNGDLTAHPDFEAIRAFTEARGVRLRWLPGYPLTDIGSILCGG